MRWLLPILLLAACSEGRQAQTDIPVTADGIWLGQGRDRMCVANRGGTWQVGVIAYGEGNNNCSMRAAVKQAEHGMVVQAMGDRDCEFLIESDGKTARFPARLPDACDYYCGPTATLSGKSFTSSPTASPAVDFAGDPLC